MSGKIDSVVFQEGFTLIELMIVIAIIGILAAIALPAYQDYIARAQVTEAINLMSGFKSAVAENYGADGECPDNRRGGKFGIEIPPQIKGNYVNQIEARPSAENADICELTAKFHAQGVSDHLKNKTITLSMQTASGSEMWSCHSDSIKSQHLPSACRSN